MTNLVFLEKTLGIPRIPVPPSQSSRAFSNMIPYQFLSKMGFYNITVDNDSTLQAVVANDAAVIADHLKKLKSSLKNPVVGVDVKLSNKYSKAKILLLSSRTFCLAVSIWWDTPKVVKDFMDDKSICFVAMNSQGLDPPVVELGYLAARVLKKPSLNKCYSFETLAGEVGVERRQPEPKLADPLEFDKISGILFSQEEVEFLVRNAYSTFLLADKLLGSL